MSSSRMEQIIDEIEEYLDNCKPVPFSQTKITVNKDEIDEMLRELRNKMPDEIKRYQKIISNKDAILADATSKADQMLEQAKIKTTELVSEHEIMQQAYTEADNIIKEASSQAEQILDVAQTQANDVRADAMLYIDDQLASIENIVANTLDSYTSRYDGIVNLLQETYDKVRGDRSSLVLPEKSHVEVEDEYSEEEYPEEEYN
ncbi:MAG: ATPase [Lachnospiraceae bacterium]|nr:ATPase [Lachnospiraceae bacterium]